MFFIYTFIFVTFVTMICLIVKYSSDNEDDKFHATCKSCKLIINNATVNDVYTLCMDYFIQHCSDVILQ